MEALGFTQFWGSTPAINVFEGCDQIDPTSDDQEINILMSECGGDARHVMKSICDILPMQSSLISKLSGIDPCIRNPCAFYNLR